jgi:hypothetical protein
MAVKCGSCHEKHNTVAQVRLCYENKARAQAQEREDEAQAKAEAEMERRTERFYEEGTEAQHAQYQHEVEMDESRAFNDEWSQWKDRAAEREQQQERAAYQAEMDEEEQAALALDGLTGGPGRDMASTAQVDYVMDLLARKEWPDTLTRENVENMPRAQVSKLINALNASKDRLDQSDSEPDAGVYVVDGEYHVRVYHGQRSGRMLAKRIIIGAEPDASGFLPVSYEYVGTAVKVKSKSHTFVAMSMEEVGALGVSTNHCMVCGRRLDDPVSVDRGIGPVCIDKMGWAS